MKKLKLFFALFAMLALGVGNAWGAETLYKNALFKAANCTNNSSYTGKVTCTIGDDSWVAQNAANNNGGWDYVKIGAKKSKSSDPTKVTTGTITTDAAYAEAVSKIVVNGKKDRGSFTSKLIIASNSSFTTDKVEITGATSFTNNQIVFEIASPSANKYYKLEFVCSNTTTTNGVIQVSSVEYYSQLSTSEASVPTFSVPECTFYSSSIDIELNCATDGATIHYTLDGSTPTATSLTYSGAIAINNTTTINAIAIKDGMTNSKVATATYTKGEPVSSYDIDFEMNALEAYVNWDFSNITITTATIQAKAGTYYANTSGKASASIKTKTAIQYPGTLTFYTSKESNNTTSSNWIVQVSENGSTWTEVTSFDATTGSKGTWTERTADLSDYENVYVQISYGSSTAMRAIDEISLAQGVAPVKYTLTIESPEKGTLLVTNGGASVASGDQFKAGTSLVVTPTPATGYVFESLTVDGSAVELTDGTYTFNMPAAGVTIAATFKENEKPAATLTLSKNGETEDITGYKQDDKVTLPSITSDCVKEFVGWSVDPNCTTEPEYKDGDEYTLASTTQTLYAVYATVDGGGETTAANTLSSNGWANESKHTSLPIDENVKAAVTGGGNTGKYYTSGTNWRLYQNEDAKITISTSLGELKSVKFTFTNSNTGTLLYNGTKLTSGTAVEVSGTSAIFTVGNSTASVTNGQIRISKIEVVYTGGVSYSNYSTTCVAALAAPTFSVAEGTYTEAKSIELSATEGTIYYTLDGFTPTASSEKYTTPIVLDECGEHTIKAIAISADSESPVASATYEIQLPIPANSETDPYTEAEAIEIYNGGCYDGAELVYVKGTVKTATFYSSGTYTITLTNGFQFYKFYKSATKELFTDGAINAGDVLVACGKLSKYNTTYQLAEGCYLVAHEPYTEPKVDISNTEASAYTVDKAFELIGDVSSDLTKEVFVKGLVAVAPTSNPTADGQMTYSISDNGEKTGKVLKVYLGLGLNGDKFTSKNDVKLGDYVVVKGLLLDYNGTYELNKGNQLVQHVKAATITIADITMEVEEVKTISATVVPAEAEVTYTIKENTDNAISLSGKTITALAEGTATITATVAEGTTYMGNSVDFTVTVGPKSEKTNVVILAEYKEKWYALVAAKGSANNTLGAVEVTYVNGVILDFVGDKASITWERAIVGNKATFKNGTNYVKGATGDTDLTLETSAFEWEVVDGKYLVESKRTFLYNKAGYFKNYDAKTNAGKGDYSAWPVVTAVEFMNSVATPSVEKGIFSVADGKFVQFSTGNLQYKVGTNTWSFAENQYDYVGEANINVGNPNYEGKIDMFGWSADGKFGVNPSNKNEDYYGTFQDWGKLVDEANWYTLSADEWKYLLNTRANAANLKQIAKVNNGEKDIVGIMLFPDAWAMPADVNVAAAYDDYFKVNIYNYTLEQWAKLEAAGAVFLPAAGRRTGGYGNMINYDQQVETREDYLVNGGFYRWQDNTNIYCYYWTSTINESKDVSYLHNIQALGGDEYTIGTGAVWGEKGRYGQSVRLVKAIKPNYKREVRQGYYGTICLENGGQMIGASLFELSYYNEAQGLLYMQETADATMVAGNPYIFLPNERATKDSLYVFYDETTAAAKTVNGLVGSFESKPLDADGTNYIMKDNKIMKVVGEYASVGAYKAYIKLGDVSKNEPAPVPGRRRVAIGQAPQVATGMESVDASAQPVKMIIDGQLYILRGEKMYDAQGKLVK